jgi:hypothetical protein
LKCGIVFSKYKPPVDVSGISGPTVAVAEQPDAAVPPIPHDARMAEAMVSSFVASLDKALLPDADESPDAIRKAAAAEFKYRLLALPLSLLVARWLTGTGFNFVAGMLGMLVHEPGHAVTAWLAGRWAIPTLWVTPMGETRLWWVVILVTGVIFFGGFQALRAQRWGFFGLAVALLVLQMYLLSVPPGAWIIFGGEGGAMVLSTILMAMFYARRDGVLRKTGALRWGLLIIGTLAFMHTYRLWSGPVENIPFGEIEGVNLSDPSLLTELYGWTVFQMMDRYLLLAKLCFTAMGAMYLGGLISAYLAMRSPAQQRT